MDEVAQQDDTNTPAQTAQSFAQAPVKPTQAPVKPTQTERTSCGFCGGYHTAERPTPSTTPNANQQTNTSTNEDAQFQELLQQYISELTKLQSQRNSNNRTLNQNQPQQPQNQNQPQQTQNQTNFANPLLSQSYNPLLDRFFQQRPTTMADVGPLFTMLPPYLLYGNPFC